uniref:AAA family ATPase n=1 Tax=Salmonella sp. s51933 TaxID=3160127 RepID=UPI003755184A
VTFSGLLNTLDGVASTEERIVFMTTNFLNRHDPALIRPGRVDFKQEIGYADTNQVRRMYERFYPEEPSSSARDFEEKVMALGQLKSIAQLQGYFMLHKTSPSAAMKNTQTLED